MIRRANANKLTEPQRMVLEKIGDNPGVFGPGAFDKTVYRNLFFANPALIEERRVADEFSSVKRAKKVFLTEAGLTAIGRKAAMDSNTPADNLRQALRDVKAGRVHPVATLWEGIDSEPEPGSEAKDEYTRDEERARLIARIRELEEALRIIDNTLEDEPVGE